MNFTPQDYKSVLTEELRVLKKDMLIENERNKIINRSIKPRATRLIHQKRIQDEINSIKDRYRHVAISSEKEDRLATEIKKQKNEDITNIKRRQQLRANNLDLRDVEVKLKAAYISKELTAQMAEKEYMKLREKELENASLAIATKGMHSPQEFHRLTKQAEINKQTEYRKEIQDQVIKNYQDKQHSYEETLLEKKRIDQIMQRMNDEDIAEQEHKICKMKRFKEEIDAFKAAREVWREKERNAIEEEDRKMKNYLKRKELEDNEKEKQRNDKLIAKQKIIDEIGKKMYLEEIQKKNRRDVLQSLLEEEIEMQKDQQEKDEFNKQLQLRLDSQRCLELQLEEQRNKRKKDIEEEERYRADLRNQRIELLEDQRIAREKKNLKKFETKRDFLDDIKSRQAKRAESLRSISYIQEQDRIQEEKDRKIIEDERMRLMKSHSANLIGYLPPGLLRPDDLAKLGPEYVTYYSASEKPK